MIAMPRKEFDIALFRPHYLLSNPHVQSIFSGLFLRGESFNYIRERFETPDGDFFYFMNTETYDQIPVDGDKVGSVANYLRENIKCNVVLYGEEVIAIELPNVVTLTVNQTDPGHKGDTAQGALKPATLETGIVVNVPLFINEGDDIRVNTDSGEYVERA